MKIFISWSGDTSHKIAIELKAWFPLILQQIDPWISSEDIRKGDRWNPEIVNSLEAAEFGIICLSSENISSPWLNFEAGALAIRLSGSLATLIIDDIPISQVSGPLSQFQHTKWDKDDVFKLILSLNERLTESVSEKNIELIFEKLWNDIDGKIKRIIGEYENKPVEIKLSDLVDESFIIAGRTFKDAVIKGPAIIYPEMCEFIKCTFLDEIEPTLWSLDKNRRESIVGAICVNRCRFENCKFHGVGICGSTELHENMRSGSVSTKGD